MKKKISEGRKRWNGIKQADYEVDYHDCNGTSYDNWRIVQSVSAENKIARYNRQRIQYMRALCTDTSIILIAKDTHLNSDQG